MVKRCIKQLIPKNILNIRHLFYAYVGMVWYRHPSSQLIVIGITGTSGKSSTTYLLRRLLEAAGHRVGSLSTIDFYINGKQYWNDQKMTMLGKMQVQKYLRMMVDAGCTIAIVETTSEGFLQHRHRGIWYDAMLLTNLYPEHLESHGGFDNYKAAKKGIFSYVASLPQKMVNGKVIPRFSVVNAANTYAQEFLSISFPHTYLFALNDQELFVDTKELARQHVSLLLAKNVSCNARGISFTIDDHSVQSKLYGDHNVANLLAGFAVLKGLSITIESIIPVIADVCSIPGRIEWIQEAEQYQFQVIVDYAFEPEAMKKLYDVIDMVSPKRVIHVLGSTGGGRDKERRFSVGAMVGEKADVVIVTNEDPYDDDPLSIMQDVASAVRNTGKHTDDSLLLEIDRRKAIYQALSMATPGDIVVITGKGSEQAMVVKGQLLPWDDRQVVRDGLSLRKDV